MAGIIVELLISWILLWIFDKKHLSVLGFAPTNKRLVHFIIGLLFAIACCVLFNLMATGFSGNGWKRNEQFSGLDVLNGLWWNVKSVLYEELIFRGALLYIAIKKLGALKACILSAACFGVYHWFSYNSFGNPFQMTMVFLITGIMGFALAYAFYKTASLYLPIAIHLGWNFINSIIFSNGSTNPQLFVTVNNNRLEGFISVLVFLFQSLALPVLVILYSNTLKGKPVLSEG